MMHRNNQLGCNLSALMNLFEKYGGVPTVSRIVSRFYREVLERPTLRPYFEGVDMALSLIHI